CLPDYPCSGRCRPNDDRDADEEHAEPGAAQHRPPPHSSAPQRSSSLKVQWQCECQDSVQ
ncbi:unnamed protein product, partial [Symbiodinium pilosum]